MKTLNIGLLGYGTVSAGFYNQLEQVAGQIEAKTGYQPVISRILVKKGEGLSLPEAIRSKLTDSPEHVIQDTSIQVIVEAINGDEPAASFLEQALLQGKHVITANKAAVARHWHRLQAAATAGNSRLYLEASVCAGIPVLQVIETISQSDKIVAIEGILNGTSNYILTAMSERGIEYEEALQEAQALGYAESEPSADVDGIDAANKLSILCGLAFHQPVHPDGIEKETIREVKAVPGLKLVASARREGPQLHTEVKLKALPDTHPLYQIKGVENGVVITTEGLGCLRFYGAGAGAEPTGTAMVSDLYRLTEQLGNL